MPQTLGFGSCYTPSVPGTPEAIATLEEQLAATRAGGTYFEPPIELVEASGEDRQRFLNGFVTCDVAALPPETWSYGFCANVKGRILTDFHALSQGDSLLLEVPSGQAQPTIEHLLKYRIADRVELTRRDAVAFVLFGGNLDALELGGLPAADGGVPTLGVAGDLTVIRRKVAGVSTTILYVPPKAAAAWRRVLASAGYMALTEQAWNCLHVEAGRLRFAIDFGDDCFPQETGLEDEAVSYTKGCYLGQEVIARIHYRGGVNRLPRGLYFSGDLPATGTDLQLAGRSVGHVGAVAASPRLGPIGLAILHRRGAEAGAQLELSAGGTARVTELPFPDPV